MNSSIPTIICPSTVTFVRLLLVLLKTERLEAEHGDRQGQHQQDPEQCGHAIT